VSVIGLIAQLVVLAALDGGAAAPVPAPTPAPKSEIIGVWKGSSICTKVEENEFCHDESVVYTVVDVPGQPATVALKAERVVDQSLQPMYALYFTYRPDHGNWTCEFTRPRFRGIWAYVIHGDEMTGTATVLPSGKIVRNVSATRAPQGPAAAP
jgi:hypothetical protein